MIERLARALEHVEEVPEDVQEEIAEMIEEFSDRRRPRRRRARDLAGVWSDLPDDMEETLLRWRRESTPTPPIEDQLAWMKDE